MIDLDENIKDVILLNLPYVHRKPYAELKFKMIDDLESSNLKNLRDMSNAILADYIVETDTMILFVKRSEHPISDARLLSAQFQANDINDIPDIGNFEDLEFNHQLKLFVEYINIIVNYPIGIFIPDQIGFLNLGENILRRKYNFNNDTHYYIIAISKC